MSREEGRRMRGSSGKGQEREEHHVHHCCRKEESQLKWQHNITHSACVKSEEKRGRERAEPGMRTDPGDVCERLTL